MPSVALAKLQFKEKLLQSGRSGGSDALQKRLRTLHEELKSLDQDAVDTKSLQKVAHELVERQILLHRDTGVKAYTCCCLVDMLRLFAPDAPYTNFQIDDIFNFILDQIESNLRAPAAIFSNATKSRGNKESAAANNGKITDIPYYQEYLYTIESLANIKSVLLVADVQKPEPLILRHFEVYFKILRPSMNRSLLGYLQEILTALVADSRDALPEGILELLLAQVQTFKDHPDHSAFVLATSVLRDVAEPLQRYLHAYFTDIVLRHGKDPLDEEMDKLNSAYSLLVTLYQHCPDILTNVVPVLEGQVRGDNHVLREFATRALGQMFGTIPAASGGGGAAAAQFASLAGPMMSTWKAWLGRRMDKSVAIRLAWVISARDVLVNHQEMRAEVEAALREKLVDPEEKVRAAVCKLYGGLPYEVALHHVDVASLRCVAERVQDKKASVTTEALEALGQLYSAAHTEIEGNEALAISQFSWIPEAIMHALYGGASPELTVSVRRALLSYILPLPSKADEEKGWTDRLLVVARHMDAKAFKALMVCSNLSKPGIQPWNMFAAACEDYNKSPSKEKKDFLTRLSQRLACVLHEPVAAEKALLEFADASVPRLYKLLRHLTDIDVDLKTVIKSKAELLKKLEESHADVVDVMADVLNQGTLWVINRSSIPHLLQQLTVESTDKSVPTAQNILSYVSKHCPALFTSHAAALQVALISKHVAHSEVALQALSSLAKFDPDASIKDARVLDKISGFCTNGSVKQAKYAARMLGHSSLGKTRCIAVVESALQVIEDGDEEHLLPSLSALAELVRVRIPALEEKGDAITKATVDNALTYRFSGEQDDEEIWIPLDELSIREQAKVLALNIGINRCLGQVKQAEVAEGTRMTIRSLVRIIEGEGRITDDTKEGGSLRLHLRLKAAAGLLKLAEHGKFDRELTNADFENVALTVQDSEFMIRAGFLQKLRKYLPTGHYSARWNMVPLLSAVDPDESNVQMARIIMRSLVKRMDGKTRIELLDRGFTRLLYILAHHPDFYGADQQDIQVMSKYVRLYLDILANQDNVSLLYHLASRLKTVKDRHRDDDEKLYIISEMACLMLNHYAKQHSWVIATHPGKESMPKDIFATFPTGSDAIRQVRTKSYLPEEAKGWIFEPTRKPAASRVKERITGKKRAAGSSAAKSRAKRAKRDQSEEDTDGESEEEAEDEEDEENVEEAAVSAEEASPEPEEGEQVLGRGGTRRAKRKPTRQSRPKKDARKTSPYAASPPEEESDLTDLE